MAGLLDFLQSASNAAASNVSGPVDGIAWLLRKAGIPVNEPVGGSAWMERQGLTRPVQQSAASLAGESVGLLAPIVAAAKAPQIAKGLLQVGENAAAPSLLNKQRGVFMGDLSKTWDKAAADKAIAMEKAGADPRAIWQETGTFKGADGKWRQEIDDSVADVPRYSKRIMQPLEEAMLHEPLEQAYPTVKNIIVETSPGSALSGAEYRPNVKFHKYGDRENILIRNSEESAAQNKSLVLHELQHAIQQRQGFSGGGNPAFLSAEFADPHDAYWRLAGEAEARAVQARRNLTPAQRRALFPLDSYDVPLDKLIVR